MKNCNCLLIKYFAIFIKKHRIAIGKSISQISQDNNISKSTWTNIEKETALNIKLSTMCKIAKSLNLSLYDLLIEAEHIMLEDF